MWYREKNKEEIGGRHGKVVPTDKESGFLCTWRKI